MEPAGSTTLSRKGGGGSSAKGWDLMQIGCEVRTDFAPQFDSLRAKWPGSFSKNRDKAMSGSSDSGVNDLRLEQMRQTVRGKIGEDSAESSADTSFETVSKQLEVCQSWFRRDADSEELGMWAVSIRFFQYQDPYLGELQLGHYRRHHDTRPV